MPKSHSINGISYLVKGFSFLTKPGLKRFVIMPILINIVLYSLLFITGYYSIGFLSSLLPEWLRWLQWLFWIALFFGGFIIMIYTFTILANLIGAPFNGLLSEKVEFLMTQKKLPKDSGLRDVPRSLKREWQKIKYYLPRALFLLILFFIPGINLIASILWFVFGCWMMAIEYIDYPMDNHRIEFKALHKHLRGHCLSSLSFGFGVAIASMIPIINFVVMPAAVIGATIMWIDQNK